MIAGILAESVADVRILAEPLVAIPDPSDVDLPLEVLASLVARTSNEYTRRARFAGMARAHAKLARGRYERIYKQHRGQGRNDKERDAAAMTAAAEHHEAMCDAEAVAEVADALEAAARVASESARKLFDKAHAMTVGVRREQHGMLQDSDFQPY